MSFPCVKKTRSSFLLDRLVYQQIVRQFDLRRRSQRLLKCLHSSGRFSCGFLEMAMSKEFSTITAKSTRSIHDWCWRLVSAEGNENKALGSLLVWLCEMVFTLILWLLRGHLWNRVVSSWKVFKMQEVVRSELSADFLCGTWSHRVKIRTPKCISPFFTFEDLGE